VTSPLLITIGAVVVIVLLLLLFVPPLLRWIGVSPSQGTPVSSTSVSVRPTIVFGSSSARQNGQQSATEVAADFGPTPAGPSATFNTFYQQHGGMEVLGLPISNEMTVNGRRIQWFERARLEYWPENQGTAYEVQLGRLGSEIMQGRRLGSEIMQGRTFQKPAPFVSQPGLTYFPETGYAVGEPFLSYWTQAGGVYAFGYPISNAVPEQLADGQVHTVQYFERARFELHQNDPVHPVQLGLLGRALFAQDRVPSTVATPRIITAPGPTNVPMP
jgi:hypothetical protein